MNLILIDRGNNVCSGGGREGELLSKKEGFGETNGILLGKSGLAASSFPVIPEWFRSPYGLPPFPPPLPCSVIKTYFEVTDSETAGDLERCALIISSRPYAVLRRSPRKPSSQPVQSTVSVAGGYFVGPPKYSILQNRLSPQSIETKL